MSMHHQRMLARYGLAQTSSLYSQVAFDPIFTPLFTAILGNVTIGATGITVASVASAITVTALSGGMIVR